jgi:hypothetical protein
MHNIDVNTSDENLKNLIVNQFSNPKSCNHISIFCAFRKLIFTIHIVRNACARGGMMVHGFFVSPMGEMLWMDY